MTSGDYPNHSIIEIGQNTEKSPGDLGRLAVSQTPVWKAWKGVNNNNNNDKWKLYTQYFLITLYEE